MSRIGKSAETKSRSVDAWGWERGDNEQCLLMGIGFLFGVKVLKLTVVMVVHIYEYTKNE